MRRVRRGAVALAAIFAAAAIAPPLAGAKAVDYAGPIALPPIEPDVAPASIELKVHLKKKKGAKKFKPRFVQVKEHNVYETCHPGVTSRYVFPSDNNSETNFSVNLTEGDIDVKKRKFSLHESVGPGDEIPATNSSLALDGRIPKKGPATGTLRMTFHIDANPEPADPRFPEPAEDCDTGVLSWTADKQ